MHPLSAFALLIDLISARIEQARMRFRRRIVHDPTYFLYSPSPMLRITSTLSHTNEATMLLKARREDQNEEPNGAKSFA